MNNRAFPPAQGKLGGKSSSQKSGGKNLLRPFTFPPFTNIFSATNLLFPHVLTQTDKVKLKEDTAKENWCYTYLSNSTEVRFASPESTPTLCFPNPDLKDGPKNSPFFWEGAGFFAIFVREEGEDEDRGATFTLSITLIAKSG